MIRIRFRVYCRRASDLKKNRDNRTIVVQFVPGMSATEGIVRIYRVRVLHSVLHFEQSATAWFEECDPIIPRALFILPSQTTFLSYLYLVAGQIWDCIGERETVSHVGVHQN